MSALTQAVLSSASGWAALEAREYGSPTVSSRVLDWTAAQGEVAYTALLDPAGGVIAAGHDLSLLERADLLASPALKPVLGGAPESVSNVLAAADQGAGVVDLAISLRIASDYADLEAEHADADVALGAMRGRGIYDQRLLRAFAGLVGVGLSAPVREVSVGELSVGTMLVEDVRSVGGVLLVARGQRVTDQLIERVMNLTTGFVHEPRRVSEAGRRA